MSIFSKKQFELCDVPVPHGYPQSQTHCGIIYAGGKYYLSTSPYPNPIRPLWWLYILLALRKITLGVFDPFYRGEDFENPLIYVGCKYNNSGHPIGFKLLEGNPIMPKPIDKYGLGSYCSDPDLMNKDEYFYILNRSSFRRSNTGEASVDYETHSHIVRCLVYNDKIQVKDIVHLFEENDVSPCLFYYNDKYYYTSLRTSSYNDGRPCEALFVRNSKDPLSGWSEKGIIEIERGDYEPWHMSVFGYDGHMYSIIACVKRGEKQRCWQMLGEFNEDLTKLKIYQTPLTDYKSYRGSAIVTEGGEFLLYTTTMNESIRGSKSVDGRDVIMAHASFCDVLEQVRSNG